MRDDRAIMHNNSADWNLAGLSRLTGFHQGSHHRIQIGNHAQILRQIQRFPTRTSDEESPNQKLPILSCPPFRCEW